MTECFHSSKSFRLYTIDLSFKDEANLSNVDNEFDIEYNCSYLLNLLNFVILFAFTQLPHRSETKQTSAMKITNCYSLLNLLKFVLLLCFYTIAFSFEDKANLSDVDNEFDTE